jgi:hypothetical protein
MGHVASEVTTKGLIDLADVDDPSIAWPSEGMLLDGGWLQQRKLKVRAARLMKQNR